MNTDNKYNLQSLSVTARGQRQSMDHAMRGKIERALVELITNADDSYRDLEEDKKPTSGAIRIEILRRRGANKLVVVRDRAEGMSRSEMLSKLVRIGQRVSGFEQGRERRGLMGRGSRDVAAFGVVHFESIHDNLYNDFVIDKSLETYFTNEKPLRVTEQLRSKLHIPKGNGTTVTIDVENHFVIPNHENLLRILTRYYSLRDILSSNNRKVILVDLVGPREDRLNYIYPSGEEVTDVELDIKQYPAAKARLSLLLSGTAFSQDKSSERDGILVTSAAAIHECTYFGIESEPMAWRFSGRLFCPYIDHLLRQYDDEEENNIDHNALNPFRLLSPDRDGLSSEHPFTKALYTAARAVFETKVDEIKAKSTSNQRDVASDRLNKRLESLSRSLSKLFERKLIELDAELQSGDDNTGLIDKLGVGLHILPPGEHPIRCEETKTFSIVLKQHGEIPKDQKIDFISSNSEIAVQLAGNSFQKFSFDGTVARTTLTVLGTKVGEETLITVRSGIFESDISVRVVERLDAPEQTGLWFEKSRYRIESNKETTLTLRLRADVAGSKNVHLISTDPSIVLRGGAYSDLRPSKIPGLYVGSIRIIGKQDKAKGIITAQIANYEAQTEILVDKRQPKSGLKLRIEPEEENYGTTRYKWDLRDPYFLHIGAKHPTIRPFLGELTSDGYSGIDSPYYSIVLAEVIAEALSFRLLQSIFIREGENKKLDYDETDLYYHRNFSELLPVTQRLVETIEVDIPQTS